MVPGGRDDEVTAVTGRGCDAEDPAAVFRALERRLLEAHRVRCEFHVTAEGGVEADLRGAMEVGPEGVVRLTAAGHFGGQPADVVLTAAGGEMAFGSAAAPGTVVTPPHLREALVLGWTRMGVLHNLARLTAGRPPDRGEGGVGEWAIVGEFAGGGEAAALSFEIAVNGAPAGSAGLELDVEGVPVIRWQTVRFPAGEMRVVERYPVCTIEP